MLLQSLYLYAKSVVYHVWKLWLLLMNCLRIHTLKPFGWIKTYILLRCPYFRSG